MNTEKIKQHYVPKFYLKNFSNYNNRKGIGLYRIKDDLFVSNASIKDQAYRAYYYGKDGIIEDVLSIIEYRSSLIINKIINENIIPDKTSTNFTYLLMFIMTLILRNPKSEDKLNDSIMDFINLVAKKNNEEPFSNKYKIQIDNAIGISLSSIEMAMDYSQDLEIKLLKNNTNIPFILNDNPVIPYNQFLEFFKISGNITYYTALGIEYFFPINPKYMLFIFDPWTYHIKDKHKNIIELNDENEIQHINLLNFLNCDNNIYFNNQINSIEIRDINRKSKKFVKANQTKLKEYIENGKNVNDYPYKSIIVTTSTSVRCKLNLFFVKLSNKAEYYKFDKSLVYMRKPCEKIYKNIYPDSKLNTPHKTKDYTIYKRVD